MKLGPKTQSEIMQDRIDIASDWQYQRAVDEVLLDQDEYTNWLYGECNHVQVDPATSDRFIRWVVLDRPVEFEDFGAAVLNYVLVTGGDKSALKARAMLRSEYARVMKDTVERAMIDIIEADEENA